MRIDEMENGKTALAMATFCVVVAVIMAVFR